MENTTPPNSPSVAPVSSNSGTQTPTRPSLPTDHHHDDCANCGRKALILPKEISSLVILLLLVGLTIAGVLLVTTKRELLTAQRQTPATETTEAAQPDYPLPATPSYARTVALPDPQISGGMPLQTALQQRRTRRDFSDQPVTLAQLSQMLWSAQGITDQASGKRIAPSAREGYPLTVYVVVRSVQGLDPGLYEYLPVTHSLGKTNLANAGEALNESGVQAGAQAAPVVFILTGSYGKSAQKMSSNPEAATLLEAGHVGQNMYLETESLGMAMVVMAGFSPDQVQTALQIDPANTPIYVIPFGHRGEPAAETGE